MTQNKLKVLFVCAFAHYTGHFSYAAVFETAAISRAGAEVELLTFCGARDQKDVKVPSYTTKQFLRLRMFFYYIANFFRCWTATQRISMFLETWLTQSVAIELKKKLNIDVYYLRDGEPFPFMIHLLTAFTKNYKFIVSYTGTNLLTYSSLLQSLRKNVKEFLYLLLLRSVNSPAWKPVFLTSMKKNSFIFTTQNEYMKSRFEEYVGGALRGKVVYIPLGLENRADKIEKAIARSHFGLLMDKQVILSFGFFHVGKDLDVVFHAISDLPGIMLLHGGHAGGLNTNFNDIQAIAAKYDMLDRSVIRNYYVPEEEKVLFFSAADVNILSYSRDFTGTTSLLWEASRFQIPIIASDNTQLKELVEKYNIGLVFEAQNVDSLRRALVQFLELSTKQKEELSDNCRRFNEEFSLDRWGEKIIEIYGSL